MEEKINKLKSKSEQAKELGIEIPEDYDWGNMSSKTCGSVGGAIGGNYTKNAVEDFEKKLSK